ncbi:MAG: type II 3-dehydroquinate dehydratase [Burkholderiales bacterium]
MKIPVPEGACDTHIHFYDEKLPVAAGTFMPGPFPVEFRQSNAEHQIVDWIHEAIDRGAGIVINPAGLTFRSIPILDALKMFPGPIFELHSTNVHRREAIYHDSLISSVATAVLMGLGPDGYPTAVAAMVRLLAK